MQLSLAMASNARTSADSFISTSKGAAAGMGHRAHSRLRLSTPTARRVLDDATVVVRRSDGETGRRVEQALDAGLRGEEGLDRFVYLRGRSGRRYVFSAIQPRHVALYRGAIFAVRDGETARVIECVEPIVNGAAVYVHLQAEGDDARVAALLDLRD